MLIHRLIYFPAALLIVALLSSCVSLSDDSAPTPKQQKVDFDVVVTRDGKVIPAEKIGMMTKSSPMVDSSEKAGTMDESIPFGLMGVDEATGSLLIDNAKASFDGSSYSLFLNPYIWDVPVDRVLALSAYYPFVNETTYNEDEVSYLIPYSVEETSAGPLVSKTVKQAVAMLDMVPLVLQHITNDIGYRICDVTPVPELQGLVHLRKLTAYNVASAGVFKNDINLGQGLWRRQGYYRNVVVFEGDAKVGVGSQNEKFVGFNTLEDRMADSHRYYSIPDEIEMGKQYVEVVFDIDGFTLNGFYYEPLKNQVARYMLYGLLPDNTFVYGKQYTFHIGIDLSTVYTQITFDASVAGWENAIYENNDEF